MLATGWETGTCQTEEEMANWMVMPAQCDSFFTYTHTHTYTHALAPQTCPCPYYRAVKAGIEKENETGGTSL